MNKKIVLKFGTVDISKSGVDKMKPTGKILPAMYDLAKKILSNTIKNKLLYQKLTTRPLIY